MSGDSSQGPLSGLGVRIQNAQDADQLRWLLSCASEQAIRLAARHLGARQAPRPHEVIAALGLERRHSRREQAPVPLERVRAHARARTQGWREGAAG